MARALEARTPGGRPDSYGAVRYRVAFSDPEGRPADDSQARFWQAEGYDVRSLWVVGVSGELEDAADPELFWNREGWERFPDPPPIDPDHETEDLEAGAIESTGGRLSRP